MSENARIAEEIFFAALDLATAQERSAFVDSACAGQPDLLKRVEELLAAHQQSRGPLDDPLPSLGATIDQVPVLERPGMLIGPYKLLQQIGAGGMGVVYLAEQQEPVRRKVALKIIRPGMDSGQVLARFEAERQALALMEHPNIARVLDAGTNQTGRPYFVMELVKGLPITQYCDELHLPIRERLELFGPVCQAIQHAHQKGIIHRDIKPSNVLVCLQDGKPLAKVIDFGVAKALNQKLSQHSLYTEIGQILGTLEYMSPEQAELSALDVDTRADIYALGVLLYELLTGSTPLDRKRLKSAAMQELLRVIREEEPPRPSTRLTNSKEALADLAVRRRTEPGRLAKEVCGELDWIVMKCLEKDRTRRYETANGLGRDVERYLKDEAVEACPPSAAYRLKKLLRRHKGPVMALAAVFLVLVAGVAVSTWQLVRASRAEVEARQQRDVAQAVRDFLKNDLLRQVDAGVQVDNLRRLGGVGFEVQENPTIKELLDRAAAGLTAERIEQKFPQQPLVQAEILYTVGISYSDVGEYAKAITHLLRAADLWRAQLGPDHSSTLDALHNLACANSSAGNREEAITLCEKVRDGRVSSLGPDHPHTLATMTNLAWLTFSAGKKEEGIALLEKVRDTEMTKLGPDHLTTLQTLEALAIGYHDAGRIAESVALLEKIRDKVIAKLGYDHPTTLHLLRNLADVYRDAGTNDKAIALIDQMLPKARRILGEGHSVTTGYQVCLISCLQTSKQFGREAEAWAELAAGARQRLVANDPVRATNFAALLAQQGLALLNAGKPVDAEAVLRECLAIREKHEADVWTTFDTKALLGGSLLDQKKYTDAEPLLLSGYEGLKQREAKIEAVLHGTTCFSEALERLVRLYEATGKPEEAEKWRKQLEEAKALPKPPVRGTKPVQ